jgi:hypothetical protein
MGVERVRADAVDREVPGPHRPRRLTQSLEGAGDDERQHAPLNGGQLQAALGVEAMEAEQAVDERVGDRGLDPEADPGREARPAQLGDQPRAPQA